MSGMGVHVKKTVSSRKDFRPHTSDSAPIRGALRNDNSPCEERHRGEESEEGTQLKRKGRVRKEEGRNFGSVSENTKEKAYNETKVMGRSIEL